VNVINAVQVSDSLLITGQVVPEQLKQAIQEGVKSVLNLRSPYELGFLKNEQQVVEALGLQYANVPLPLETLSEELITKILTRLEHLPKPTVVHCAAGMRSMAIALLSVAIQEGLTPEQTLAKARSLGFELLDYACINPQLKQFFIQYVAKRVKVSAA
jgi:uncharacterized protein (TIGR01244 family)